MWEQQIWEQQIWEPALASSKIRLKADPGSPMTYSIDGKQYLTVSIGGAGHPAELVVFTVGS